MNLYDAALLGLVEGLTEFLPISSTGHLVLAGRFLRLEDTTFAKAFDVIIQSGAILAVIWHYRVPLVGRLASFFRGERAGRSLALALLVAFLPAALAGLVWASAIKTHLFGVTPVAWALLLGGIFMIASEQFLPRAARTLSNPEHDGLARVTLSQAFRIGLFQVFALWPGASRSMTTILGGRFAGLDARASAEFSFLLAIPTLLAATAYDLFKIRHESGLSESVPALLIGSVVSFVVALLVIRGFLRFLQTHSLTIFGWYRVVLGLLLLVLYRDAG